MYLINKRSIIILAALSFGVTLYGFAKESLPSVKQIQAETKLLDQRMDHVIQACGEPEHGLAVANDTAFNEDDADTLNKNKKAKDKTDRMACYFEAARTLDSYDQLKAKSDLLPGGSTQNCINCGDHSNVTLESPNQAEKLAVNLEKVGQSETSKACQADPKDEQNFFQGVACNLGRTVVNNNPLARLFEMSSTYKSSKDSTCLSSNKEDCLSTAIKGAVLDLWQFGAMIKDIGSWAAEKTGLKFLWNKVTGHEDALADKMHGASHVSPSLLAEFKKDPWGFVKTLASSFYKMTLDAMTEYFTCEERSAPLSVPGSKCIKPNNSWTCASWDARMNAMCGAAGFLTAEFIPTLLTAGAFTGAKAGVVAVAQLGKKIAQDTGFAQKMAEVTRAVGKTVAALPAKADLAIMKGLSKSPKELGAYANLTTKAAGAIIDARKAVDLLGAKAQLLAKYIAESKAMDKTKELAKAASESKAGQFTKKAFKVSLKVGESVTKPVTQYLKFLDKAWQAGTKGAEKGLAKLSQAWSPAEFRAFNSSMAKVIEGTDGVGAEHIRVNVQRNMTPQELEAKVNQMAKDQLERAAENDKYITEKAKADFGRAAKAEPDKKNVVVAKIEDLKDAEGNTVGKKVKMGGECEGTDLDFLFPPKFVK